jgi:ribosomal protein S18 acetylase RimI-like enzyme
LIPARVRRYETSDLDEVLVLAQKYASWDMTSTEADIEGFYATEPDLFLVAEARGKVVGFIYGKESAYPDEVLRKRGAKKAASIEILAVAQDQRRKGIGTILVNSLLGVFKDKEIDYVSLAVPAEETSAKKLYDKLGFETRALFMSKRLTK